MSRVTGFEKNAGFELMKHAMTKKGMLTQVYCAEENDKLYEGHNLHAAWEAATCVDECIVRFWEEDVHGWALLTHLNDGPENISDHDVSGFVCQWGERTNYGQSEGGPDYA